MERRSLPFFRLADRRTNFLSIQPFFRHAERVIRYCAVPILAVVVATTQFLLVQATGLSRWKGGGFGMYSEYHELQHDLALLSSEGRIIPARQVPANTLRLARLWPTPNNLNRLGVAARPAANEAVFVQLWCLDFDLPSRILRRKLVAEAYVPPSDSVR